MGRRDFITDPNRYVRTDTIRGDLRRLSVRSGVVSLGAQAALGCMAVLSGMVLARLLEPPDFGLLAMAFSFTALLSTFWNLGLPLATVQHEGLDHDQVSAMFWVNLTLSAFFALVMAATAPVLAWFYADPRLTSITLVVTAATFLGSVGVQHEALLQRQMRFGALMTIEVGSTLTGIIVGVVLALFGAAYWALVFQFVALHLTRSISLWMVCPWRPALPRLPWLESYVGLRSLLSYGFHHTGSRVLSHIGHKLDQVLVGYFGGAIVLGLYSNAFRWAQFPFKVIYSPLVGVAVSSFSRLQDDACTYRNYNRTAMQMIFAVSLPIMAFLFMEPRLVILVLLGDHWLSAVPLFRILCIASFTVCVTRVTKWLYLSQGKTRRELHWTMISTPLMILGVVGGVPWGAVGVAVGYTVAEVALAYPSIAFCLRTSHLTKRDFFGAVARPILISVGAAAVLLFSNSFFSASNLLIPVLLVKAAIFWLAACLFWVLIPGGWQAATDLLSLARELRAPRPGASRRRTTAWTTAIFDSEPPMGPNEESLAGDHGPSIFRERNSGTDSHFREHPSLRAVDWRFLLPRPVGGCFKHLVLLGGSPGLTARLSGLGLAHRISREIPHERSADCLVILHDAFASAEQAASCLVPEGALYWEVNRRSLRNFRFTPGSLRNSLRGLGFSPPAIYAIGPNVFRPRVYLPLDVPGALRWYMDTLYTPWTFSLAVAETVLRTVTRLDSRRFAPLALDLAITAVKGGDHPGPPSILDLPSLPQELSRQELRPLMLTSTHQETLSQRVVILPFPMEGTQPLAIVKVSKLPGLNATMEKEQHTLAEIRHRLDAAMRDTIPKPLDIQRIGDITLAIESYCSGESLQRLGCRWGRSVQAKLEDLRLASAWLAEFHKQTTVELRCWGTAELSQWVSEPLEAYRRCFGETEREQHLFAAAHHYGRTLMGERLPIVLRKPDFFGSNVVRSGDELSVFDWESPYTGPALCDLLRFVTPWIDVVRRVQGERSFENFRNLFFGSRNADPIASGVHQVIEQYMERLQMDRRLFPILLVYTWAERALHHFEKQRLQNETPRDERAGNRHIVRIGILAKHTNQLFGPAGLSYHKVNNGLRDSTREEG